MAESKKLSRSSPSATHDPELVRLQEEAAVTEDPILPWGGSPTRKTLRYALLYEFTIWWCVAIGFAVICVLSYLRGHPIALLGVVLFLSPLVLWRPLRRFEAFVELRQDSTAWWNSAYRAPAWFPYVVPMLPLVWGLAKFSQYMTDR
jgi:hypothetical protein